MKSRKLSLRRETVTDLRPDDLRGVAGGSGDTCVSCGTNCLITRLSVRDCLSLPLTECTILQETETVTCQTDVC